MSEFGILFPNSALLDSLNMKKSLRFASKQDSFNKILDELGLPNSIWRSIPLNFQLECKKE